MYPKGLLLISVVLRVTPAGAVPYWSPLGEPHGVGGLTGGERGQHGAEEGHGVLDRAGGGAARRGGRGLWRRLGP